MYINFRMCAICFNDSMHWSWHVLRIDSTRLVLKVLIHVIPAEASSTDSHMTPSLVLR